MAPADELQIAHMCQTLRHRGPDDGGVHCDGPVGLGHRRLSIIDLSERGRQPLSTPDGRYVITYNGEVYNYLELRNDLQQHGYVFRTDTDTEVVLALYATMGAKALDRLNGMFAFAIWDAQERKLFLARDRVGIKPLYYATTKQGLVFASEAKALFADPQVQTSVSMSAVRTYMNFGYVPGEATAFDGIRKLLPGHLMEVTANGFTQARYWDVSYKPDTGRSAEQTATQLRELLLDAIRLQLRSDVPLGVFLSGGLDSSAMVALLSESGVPGIKTFSVAYDDGPQYDETPYARLVSRRFDTEHHVLRVDAAEFADFIPDYVWHMDEPVTEAAGISLYFVARLLRQHVVVALSGEGSDELFGGYQIYRYMARLEKYRRLPPVLRRAIEPIVAATGLEKLQRYVRLARLPLEARYRGVSLPDRLAAEKVYTRDFAAVEPDEAILAECYGRSAGWDDLSRMLYADGKTWLVDDLLVKADKMTMANSVELRVPFLDHRVIEFAATIPSRLKIKGGEVKWILKEAMRGRLPAEILSRRKMGFPTPLARMFRRDLAGYLRDVLLEQRCVSRGYFDRTAVERLIGEHASGQKDHHKLLWQLLVLEEWHRRFATSLQAAA